MPDSFTPSSLEEHWQEHSHSTLSRVTMARAMCLASPLSCKFALDAPYFVIYPPYRQTILNVSVGARGLKQAG